MVLDHNATEEIIQRLAQQAVEENDIDKMFKAAFENAGCQRLQFARLLSGTVHYASGPTVPGGGGCERLPADASEHCNFCHPNRRVGRTARALPPTPDAQLDNGREGVLVGYDPSSSPT